MSAEGLRTFWSYFGAKWRAAPLYPYPAHGTIIEPFAGAAGYSLRYFNRNVILIERYHKVAEIWRYLIGASGAEIRSIPIVDHVDDLPAWLPNGARWLVGFRITSAATSPRKTATARSTWTEETRDRIAFQVDYIRHWQIIEGSWSAAPYVEATWFVDPPYQVEGKHYIHKASDLDFGRLAQGCCAMPGQVIVCENEGANWLPFVPFAELGSARSDLGKVSKEVIWYKEDPIRSQV